MNLSSNFNFLKNVSVRKNASSIHNITVFISKNHHING